MTASASTASSLAALDVLVVDGQTTGASPAHGHLMELGWARTSARRSDAPLTVEARLLALPEGATIPRPITRLTGISPGDLEGAASPPEVWAELCAAADSNGVGLPVVIHYARFERPFLKALHEASGGSGPLPWPIVCTHRIASRLWPDLPRRGLRAVAGYLGYGVDTLKRSAEHVRATAYVWRHVVEHLEREHGVSTRPQLEQWLGRPAPPRSARRAYPMDRERRLALPDAPGVYRMGRSDGSVLYVGKATSLRSRVNGYFRQHRRVPDRTLEMLTQAKQLTVTVTATALEAALLESDEIKARAPPYNVMLRPDRPGPVYASADLRQLGPAADARHPLGPLGRRPVIEALAALVHGRPLEGPVELPDERWPDARSVEPWAEGWALFWSTWAEPAWTPNRRNLIRVGARIWRAWREAKADDEVEVDAESELESEGDADEPRWDAPRIAAALEHIVGHGAHELRRAVWLRRIADASVAWRRRDRPQWRVLVLAGGTIVERDDLEPEAPRPRPPGWSGRTNPRHASMDLRTMDRLRVLTAELRRLVAAGREVELCYAPRTHLTGERLRRAIWWI